MKDNECHTPREVGQKDHERRMSSRFKRRDIWKEKKADERSSAFFVERAVKIDATEQKSLLRQ